MSKRKKPDTGGVPTKNYFSILGANKDLKNKDQVEKLPKFPPFVITSIISHKEVVGFLSAVKISNFNIKIQSIGVKIFVYSSDDYNKFADHLKSENIEFFSYEAKHDKALKVVLYGLPMMDINDIDGDLKSNHNVTPTSVEVLKSNSNTDQHTLYLLSFKSINFGLLKQIKSIKNTIINWRMYSPKYKGPTQCNNCSLYGHGARFCRRLSRCSLCTQNHSTLTCPLKDKVNDQDVAFECINCKEKKLPYNHQASDVKCPSRLDYINSRQKSISKNRSSHNRVNFNISNFPNLSKNNSMPSTSNSHVNSNFSKSFANVVNSNGNINNNCNTAEDLFSFNELFNIFMTSLTKLKQCKSKMDQLEVIASLLQYGY